MNVKVLSYNAKHKGIHLETKSFDEISKTGNSVPIPTTGQHGSWNKKCVISYVIKLSAVKYQS